MQIVFYVTPIIWSTKNLPDRANLIFIDLNPFYHMIEIVRSPLLNQWPGSVSWVFAIIMATMGWILVIKIFGKYKDRIPYWV